MKFYRYEAVQYAVIGSDGEFVSGRAPDPQLELREYLLLKETPKGYWIRYDWDSKPFKWVSKTSVKRFAYPTRAEALTNFIKRTERRAEILDHQVQFCKAAVAVAKSVVIQDTTTLIDIFRGNL